MHTKFLSENLKGRQCRRSRCRLEDIIKMDLQETGNEVVNWIQLYKDKDQSVVCCREHGNKPSIFSKGEEISCLLSDY